MDKGNSIAPKWIAPVAIFSGIFGLMTVRAGGAVLFSEAARQAAGNYVPFVVWFNFLAGFAYIAAAIGIWKSAPWAGAVSAAIAVATLAVFTAFGVTVLMGGGYEMRTVAAMTFRFGFWAAVSYGYCAFKKRCGFKTVAA